MTTEAGQAGWALAVDFGTTATTAAIVRGSAIQLVRFGATTRMPSGVFVDPVEGLLAATPALNRGGADPGRYVRTPKRHVGRDDDVLVAGRNVPVRTLVATILLAVLREAQRQAGGSAPTRVVLTHPARWGVIARDVLVDAASEAGMPQPTLVPEPVAAGQEVAATVPAGARVAVYDLGGGTFDAAVLDRTDDGSWVVAGRPGGLDPFGGEAIDSLLHRHLIAKVAELDPDAADVIKDPQTAADRGLARTWWRDLRSVKEDLSESTSSAISVPGTDHAILVSREELEGLVNRSLADSVDELARTIESAPNPSREVTQILLCGDASRMPMVDRLVREHFGSVAVRYADDPKGVVARGAVPAARHLTAAAEPRREPEVQPAPAPQVPATSAPPAAAAPGWDLGPAAAQGASLLATPKRRPEPEQRTDGPTGAERQTVGTDQGGARRRGRVWLAAAGAGVVVMGIVGVGAVLASQGGGPDPDPGSSGNIQALADRFSVSLTDSGCSSEEAAGTISCTATDPDSGQDVTTSLHQYGTAEEARAAFDARLDALGTPTTDVLTPSGYYADPDDRTGSPTGTLSIGLYADDIVFLAQSDQYVAEFTGPEFDTVERAFMDTEAQGTVDVQGIFGATFNLSGLGECWPNYPMLLATGDRVDVDCFTTTPGGAVDETEVRLIELPTSKDLDTRIEELKGDAEVLTEDSWLRGDKKAGPYVSIDRGKDVTDGRYSIIWASNDAPDLVAVATGNKLADVEALWETMAI